MNIVHDGTDTFIDNDNNRFKNKTKVDDKDIIFWSDDGQVVQPTMLLFIRRKFNRFIVNTILDK